jgi:hypothetical protein
MTDDVVATAVSRFLKNVSFTAQREVEKAVRQAIVGGKLRGNENFTTAVTLANDALGLNVTIFSKIDL